MQELIEQLKIANQNRFGRKTERLDEIDGQMSFFNEAEKLSEDAPDEEPDIRSARKNMAEILLSLRRHHFLYFSGHKRRDDMETFLEEVKKQGHTLLANGKLLQFPMNRESVSFTGTVKETQEPFFFRIYDRDLFLYLLYALRNIRREKAEI